MARHYTYLILTLVLVVDFSPALGQRGRSSSALWSLHSLTGLVGMTGEYRYQQSVFSRSEENLKSSFLYGTALVNSQSHIWHPNFLHIQLDAELNPGYRNDIFLTVPDRSETSRYERVGIETTFFRNRPLSIRGFARYARGTTLREAFSDVYERRKNLGAHMDLQNRTLPLQARYEWIDWRQHEELFGRTFFDSRHIATISVNKELSPSSKHFAELSYDDFTRKTSAITRNKLARFNFRNRFMIGSRARVNSAVALDDQVGSLPHTRIRVDEKLRVDLPQSFTLSGEYRFLDTETRGVHSRLNRVSTKLEHQLFKSLTSRIQLEYSDHEQSQLSETLSRIRVGVDYRKRIPTGRLVLSYDYEKRSNDRISESGPIPVVDERKLLEDGRLTLLEHPNVVLPSIIVTNFDRTFRYEENVDYVLIERGFHVELRRIQGGQITNGALVLVDYLAERGSASFDAPQSRISARVLLFGNSIELFANALDLDFENIQGSPPLLRKVSRQVYGTRIRYWGVTLGAEVDNFDSNVVPYRATRLDARYSTRVGRRLSVGVSGDVRKVLLKQTGEEQLFANFVGSIDYSLTRFSSLTADWYYRYQDGNGLDLRLSDVRIEYQMRLHKLFVAVGSQLFLRNFLEEQTDFVRGYLTLSRRF